MIYDELIDVDRETRRRYHEHIEKIREKNERTRAEWKRRADLCSTCGALMVPDEDAVPRCGWDPKHPQ